MNGGRTCFIYLLMPAVIGLRHVMPHGRTLKSKGNKELLPEVAETNV